MATETEIDEVLGEIRELGYVRIADGRVAESKRPLENLCSSRWDRWTPTLRYLGDYARHNADTAAAFDGEYFVCLYDGWREYTEPTPPSERTYCDYLATRPSSARIQRFLGQGNAGEPRFRPGGSADAPGPYAELPLPVLAYNRHIGDRNTLLIPDAEFLETGFDGFTTEVRAAAPVMPAFADRIPAFFWRGSRNLTPGYRYIDPAQRERQHPRTRAVALRSDPILATAGIWNASFSRANIAEFMRYRYLLDIDGMVSAWSGLYWKLMSGSVVVRAPTHWEQWYHADLRPDAHYVQLDTLTPAAIGDLHRRLEANPRASETIVRNAEAFILRRDYDYAVREYKIH